MNFSIVPLFEKRKKADVLVVPFWKNDKNVSEATKVSLIEPQVKQALDVKDFKGKEGEVLFLYPSGLQEKRIALLGLGSSKNMTVERLRRAYAALVNDCLNKKILSKLAFSRGRGLR